MLCKYRFSQAAMRLIEVLENKDTFQWLLSICIPLPSTTALHVYSADLAVTNHDRRPPICLSAGDFYVSVKALSSCLSFMERHGEANSCSTPVLHLGSCSLDNFGDVSAIEYGHFWPES